MRSKYIILLGVFLGSLIAPLGAATNAVGNPGVSGVPGAPRDSSGPPAPIQAPAVTPSQGATDAYQPRPGH